MRCSAVSGKLTEGFREIIELRWSKFVELELDKNGSNFSSGVTAIARAASKGNLRAIQIGIDRLDGKIATEIEVEYPQFFMLFPIATMTVEDDSIIDCTPRIAAPVVQSVIETTEDIEAELPTGSLRAVLEKMIDAPRHLVTDILLTAENIDKGVATKSDPYVKSVIVAGFMKLVHDGRIAAVFELFDQIDGKVVDKVKVLGEDVYINSYVSIAPAGAEKNEDGIYQIATDNVTNSWVAKLEQNNGKR